MSMELMGRFRRSLRKKKKTPTLTTVFLKPGGHDFNEAKKTPVSHMGIDRVGQSTLLKALLKGEGGKGETGIQEEGTQP